MYTEYPNNSLASEENLDIHQGTIWELKICLSQGGGSPHGLNQNSCFNSRHGLLSPLTPIITQIHLV